MRQGEALRPLGRCKNHLRFSARNDLFIQRPAHHLERKVLELRVIQVLGDDAVVLSAPPDQVREFLKITLLVMLV